MAKALVLGATGYTGKEVVRLLAEQGIPVHAHIRGDSPHIRNRIEEMSALGATPESTPWETEAIDSLFRRVQPTVVFALLGTTRKKALVAESGGQDASYEAIDYGLTKMAIDGAVRSGTRPRFVYLSSMGAGGRAQSAYMSARAKAEAELVHSGLPYTIARPSFITGPDRTESRPAEHVGAWVASGFLTLCGWLGGRDFRDKYRPTTATRLAHALIHYGYNKDGENRILTSEFLYRSGTVSVSAPT
jgi:uncharacterized protein YbjT (DUF2867 family)